MTATEAAKQLGVSRKTYYKWEQRGLEALLDGLQDQPLPDGLKRRRRQHGRLSLRSRWMR